MNLLVRVDASAEIGVGHLMRCLALAQACQDQGGRVGFAMAEGGERFRARLQAEGFQLLSLVTEVGSGDDARQTLALASQLGSSWIVVDGYRFDAAYQRAIQAGDVRQLFLDDCGHAENYYADLVLNQNLHADEDLYQKRDPEVELLLGLDYLLLRREFLNVRPTVALMREPARRILLTLGGSDRENLTGWLLQALQQLAGHELEVCALVGATNPHRQALEKVVRDSRFPLRLASAVTDMSELYAWADMAVTAGGSTLWELSYMGVPAVTLILAANQEPSSLALDRYGSIRCLGYPGELSQQQVADAVSALAMDANGRQRMSNLGRQLVDGQGAWRVVQKMDEKLAEGGR